MQEFSSVDEVLPIQLEVLPKHYAEINPEAVVNQPDKSQWYSFQDQQAADTSSKNNNSPVPLIDGSEVSSVKIVSGEVITEEMKTPSGVYQLSPNQSASFFKENNQEETPYLNISDTYSANQINPFEKVEDRNGVDVTTFKKKDDLTTSEIGQKFIVPMTKDAFSQTIREGTLDSTVPEKKRPEPMARPKLASEITKGPILQSSASANKVGVIALDASFSEFGEYEQQFYSALQVGWYNEVAFYKPMDTGTQVSISFILKSDGSIDSVKVLSSNAGMIATSICESAIIKRSPFRPWTQDMRQVFGEQKELKVRFIYR